MSNEAKRGDELRFGQELGLESGGLRWTDSLSRSVSPANMSAPTPNFPPPTRMLELPSGRPPAPVPPYGYGSAFVDSLLYRPPRMMEMFSGRVLSCVLSFLMP